MHRVTRIIAAGLAVLATLGMALMLPSAAGAATSTAVTPSRVASPQDVPAPCCSFHVYNLTGEDVKFLDMKAVWPPNFQVPISAPKIGSVIPTGGSLDYQIPAPKISWYIYDLTFQVPETPAQPKGPAQYAITIGSTTDAYTQGSFGDINVKSTTPADWQSYIATNDSKDNTIDLLDPPGTTHTITATQDHAQDQAVAEVLKQICDNSNLATCTFLTTKSDYSPGNETQISSTIRNETRDDEELELSCENTIGWSDTVGVELTAGGKIAGIVEVELKAKYEHEVTADNVFSQVITIKVRPGEEGWVTDSPPLVRDWGDFTVYMDNGSIWHLNDVYFDGPWPTPDQAHPDTWTAHVKGISGGPVSKADVLKQSAPRSQLVPAAAGGLKATQGCTVKQSTP